MKLMPLIQVTCVLIVMTLSAVSCSNMLDKYPSKDLERNLIAIPSYFSINNDAYLTYSVSVTLNCGVNGAEAMRFRNSGGAWSGWAPFARESAWIIENRAGLRRVDAEFRLISGEIASYYDDIEYVDRITAMEGASVEQLGWSVSISADGYTVAAGAPGSGTGTAFIYDWNGTAWTGRELIPADVKAGDRFGFSVSLSADGNTAAVGACCHNGEQGAVYLFERNHGGTGHWGQRVKVTGSDSAAYDKFGWSVSLSKDGNTLLSGALAHNSERGAAYIFERDRGGADAWGQSAKLTASGASQDQFGVSVAIASGDTAVVGSFWRQVDSNARQGAAYIFERSGGWGLSGILTALDGAENDYFGNSVGISADGDTIVIGSWGDDINSFGDDRGSAYVYGRGLGGGGAWGLAAKLTASDRQDSDRMGCSVAVSDDGGVIAVGAFQDDIGTKYDQGSAYLFELRGAGYAQTRHLVTVEGERIDRLGVSVALSAAGDAVAAGANFDDVNGRADEGSVYLFR